MTSAGKFFLTNCLLDERRQLVDPNTPRPYRSMRFLVPDLSNEEEHRFVETSVVDHSSDSSTDAATCLSFVLVTYPSHSSSPVHGDMELEKILNWQSVDVFRTKPFPGDRTSYVMFCGGVNVEDSFKNETPLGKDSLFRTKYLFTLPQECRPERDFSFLLAVDGSVALRVRTTGDVELCREDRSNRFGDAKNFDVDAKNISKSIPLDSVRYVTSESALVVRPRHLKSSHMHVLGQIDVTSCDPNEYNSNLYVTDGLLGTPLLPIKQEVIFIPVTVQSEETDSPSSLCSLSLGSVGVAKDGVCVAVHRVGYPRIVSSPVFPSLFVWTASFQESVVPYLLTGLNNPNKFNKNVAANVYAKLLAKLTGEKESIARKRGKQLVNKLDDM